MVDDKTSDLADAFMQNVRNVMRATGAMFRKDTEHYGVTWPQFHMLMMLRRRGTMTMSELSKSMMTAAPTTSRMVDSLSVKGLLAKTRSSKDGRVTNVELTDECRRKLQGIGERQRRIVTEVVAQEGSGELEALVAFTSKLVERLSEEEVPAADCSEQEMR